MLYDEFIHGCECADHDEERLYQNLHQPPAMKNYTKLGFQKIRAPDKLYKLLKDFWDANRDIVADSANETRIHSAATRQSSQFQFPARRLVQPMNEWLHQ